jgi:PAS domain S-box-containing protein
VDQPANATATVETYVSLLRRSLRTLESDGGGVIDTAREAYRIEPAAIDLDLDRFDELLSAAGNTDTVTERLMLERALDLAKGVIFADEPHARWAADLRRTYEARILGARLEASCSALELRDEAGALAHAEAALAIDPLAERAHRIAMVALYALGRQHEALERYRSLYGSLRELGLAPMPQTRDLQAAVLRQEPLEDLLPRAQEPTAASRSGSVIVFDPANDRFVDANDAACRLLGYTREELRATPISAVHPAEMREFLATMTAARAAGTTRTLLLTCRTKSGRFLPIDMVANALHFDGADYVVGLVAQRSDQRRAAADQAIRGLYPVVQP